MRNRPGEGVRAQLRAERRYVRLRNKWRLGIVLLAWTAIAVALNLWDAIPRWWGGFVAGAFTVSIPLVLAQLDVAFGIATRAMGLDAEQWTAGMLRPLRLRQWRVVHDVRFAGLNVDHVAIGPERILAIETKWIGAGRDLHRAVSEATSQAYACARKIRGLLRTPPSLDRDVEPVVVLWGPGIPREGIGTEEVDGVTVVTDATRRAWVRRIGAQQGRRDREAHEAIKRHQRRSIVPAPTATIGASSGHGGAKRRP